MEGTYRALCAHGYASLTMQDIADECGKSTSLLHYHFDTKEELLVSFIEYILDDFEETVVASDADDPARRLVELVAWFVLIPEDQDRQSFHSALLELRSQAPFDERYREQLIKSDDLLRETFADVLADGVEMDVFEPVDVDRTAALLVATLDGARTRQLTLGDPEYTRAVAEATLRRIVDPILAPGESLPPLASALDAGADRTRSDGDSIE
ncbi:MAG: TetR/AcrR family transcriptional regulator [Haloferacaceae archaeon]